MHRKQVQEIIKSGRTLLCVGTVSVNCVDVTIELAQRHDLPLTLIASRRQIDAEILGGGYVGSWTTSDYIDYVRRKDPEGHVILGRDHAGPWQNENFQLSLDEAMANAKKSLGVDIESGIEFIHLDASLDPQGTPGVDVILRRIFELYDFCCEQAKHWGRDIEFEFGPFSDSPVDELSVIEHVLQSVTEHCRSNKSKLPLYIVINTGTKVMEKRNVGPFEPNDQLKALVGACERYQVFLKEHNADYLSDQALLAHPALGIHCANIAPELGVIESVGLLDMLQKNGRQDLCDEFITLAVDSLKWQKWMLPGTKASREDLGKIAGHYVYSHPQGLMIREKARQVLREQGIDLEDHLKARIRSRIEHHLKCFGLMNA